MICIVNAYEILNKIGKPSARALLSRCRSVQSVARWAPCEVFGKDPKENVRKKKLMFLFSKGFWKQATLLWMQRI